MKRGDTTTQTSSGPYTVKSLVKALNILDCLAAGQSSTLTELSVRLRLHISTVHRLLVNLVRQGFVEQDPATGGYQLGFRVLRMGLQVLDRLDFRRVAQPHLRELNQQTQETVHLVILQEGRVVTIEKFESPQPVALDARLGTPLPLHCTAVGKALLAYQSEEALNRLVQSFRLERYTDRTISSLPQLKKELTSIRAQGFAVDNEEMVEGLRCVAGPLFDHTGSAIAAFSVAGPTTRLTSARVPPIADLVRKTSYEISYRLGFTPATRAAASAS